MERHEAWSLTLTLTLTLILPWDQAAFGEEVTRPARDDHLAAGITKRALNHWCFANSKTLFRRVALTLTLTLNLLLTLTLTPGASPTRRPSSAACASSVS